jgi:hypothetical protein
MFSVLIGVIVGIPAKTWMQLAGATVIVVAAWHAAKVELPRYCWIEGS